MSNNVLAPSPPIEGQERWLCIPRSDSELFSTYKGLEENGEERCLRGNQKYSGTGTPEEVLATGFSVEYDCRYVHLSQFTIYLNTGYLYTHTDIHTPQFMKTVSSQKTCSGFFHK